MQISVSCPSLQRMLPRHPSSRRQKLHRNTNFKTFVFILGNRYDTFVICTESESEKQALCVFKGRVPEQNTIVPFCTFVIADRDFSEALSSLAPGQGALTGQEPGGPHLEATKAAGTGQPQAKCSKQSHTSSQTLTLEVPSGETGLVGCLPAGLEARGEGGNRVELVEDSRGRRLRKKLLSSPHLRDSTRVVFPDPEWPNSFSLILSCRFCVGLSCWMKSPRCVS